MYVALPLRQEVDVVADEATCTRQWLADAVRGLARKTPGARGIRLHMRVAVANRYFVPGSLDTRTSKAASEPAVSVAALRKGDPQLGVRAGYAKVNTDRDQ